MLTFTHLGNQTIRISGGPMPVLAFPAEPEKGALNLLPSPAEFPSREVISWPGEYDVAGITVRGIGHLDGRKVSYMTEVDGIRIAWPVLPLEPWTDHELELLGDIHVLILPADDAKICQQILDDIDPRILMIVPGQNGSINPEVLKTCGATGQEHVKEYKLKGSLPQEGREVVVFGE